jgi:hypothetical protein
MDVSMIAYDLDGIFVNDIHILDNLHTLLKIRSENLKPLFIPIDDYVIITGRPNIDMQDTLRWFEMFFSNKPQKIFHNNTDFTKAKEYKLDTLSNIHKEYNINIFIESEKEQADFLRDNLKGIEVYHFSEFINSQLQKLKYI